MPTKKEMLRSIAAANRRLSRLRKAGYTHGDAYKTAMHAVARSRGESVFRPKHQSLQKTGTKAELQEAYRAAKGIMKEKLTTVGAIKQEIRSKRNQTMAQQYGADLNRKSEKAFYNLLNSAAFKNLRDYVSSDQIVRSIVNAHGNGASYQDMQKRLESFMAGSQDADRFYVDDLESALQGDSTEDEPEGGWPFDTEWGSDE